MTGRLQNVNIENSLEVLQTISLPLSQRHTHTHTHTHTCCTTTQYDAKHISFLISNTSPKCPRIYSWPKHNIFLVCIPVPVSRPSPSPTKFRTGLTVRVLNLGINQPPHQVNLSTKSSDGIKNGWSYMSNPPTRFHGVQINELSFYT